MSPTSPKGPPAPPDDFNHQLAIKLARALNLVNPNDLLATRVTDIARTSSEEGFLKGQSRPLPLAPAPRPSRAPYPSLLPPSSPARRSPPPPRTAAKSFGKFRDSFLAELYAEIAAHAAQEASGHVPQPVQGITVHDSEVLEPEPVRQGGLMRKDSVRAPRA